MRDITAGKALDLLAKNGVMVAPVSILGTFWALPEVIPEHRARNKPGNYQTWPPKMKKKIIKQKGKEKRAE